MAGSREQAREFFREYFSGARYHAWEDVVPPIVRVNPGGRSAWVLRRVRVDREEPALGGRMARRQFTSAWAASYEWRNGRWQMTTVTTTSVPDSPADRILAGAARAIANDGAPPLDAIRAAADAQGPGTRFEVAVTSRTAFRPASGPTRHGGRNRVGPRPLSPSRGSRSCGATSST